jgi:hypothetical protein
MIDFSVSNKIYENLDSNTGIKLYRFDGLDIPLNPNWKKIGINLSGGADSSCLLGILCKIIEEHNPDCEVHVITHHRCWNVRPWQASIALAVYEKFKEKFPNITFFRHKNYIPPELEWGVLGPITKDTTGRDKSGDQIIVASFNEYTMYNENLNAIYNATSRNPDVDFPHKMMNREKPPEEGVIKDLIFPKQKGHILIPFKFVRKDWIVAEYYRLGLEDIYQITRSCEGNLGHKTSSHIAAKLEDYKPGMYIPICGECFWCLEREWAESKLTETIKKLNE